MKNLLKLFVVVIGFTMATESYAQSFVVKGGLNLSKFLAKDDEGTYSDDFKMNPGFLFGVTSEFPISEGFSFETGLLLSTKGVKISEEESIFEEMVEFDSRVNLLYLDIPLLAKATVDLGSAKIYGAFGPYIGMGLSGKIKSEFTTMGETEKTEEDVKWGSDDEDDDFRRLDYGLSFGAGVEINAIQIGLSYGLGLANISTSSEGGSKVNNRVLGVSLGYRFGGK